MADCGVSQWSAVGVGVAQSAAAKCAIWSACAFTKDGRAVARATRGVSGTQSKVVRIKSTILHLHPSTQTYHSLPALQRHVEPFSPYVPSSRRRLFIIA